MRRLTLVLLLAALATGCHSSSTEVKNPVPDTGLFGKWKWVMSAGGWGGQTIFPDSGTAQFCTFSPDSSIDYKYVPDTSNQSWHCRFSLPRRYSFIWGDTVAFLYLSDTTRYWGRPQSLVQRSRDTLVMADEAYDGWFDYYARTR